MSWTRIGVLALLALAAGNASAAIAQQPPAQQPPAQQQQPANPAALIAAEREAMAKLSFMDGVWRGTAWMLRPGGEKHTATQTERIGPFLDGAVKVIEGRGYEADGTPSGFNALGIVSYRPQLKSYTMHSYALGNEGDFDFTLTSDGYVWVIPMGPVTIRYTAQVKGGTWHEVGDRIVAGKEPARIFEMTLTRVGDTDWPAAGAVPPK